MCASINAQFSVQFSYIPAGKVFFFVVVVFIPVLSEFQCRELVICRAATEIRSSIPLSVRDKVI
jgi:hypothetical protein